MIWQGKAFGALLGVLTAGPVGALFGAALGHVLDSKAQSQLQAFGESLRTAKPLDAAQVQEMFFRATFQLMGHLAKADGRVSEEDIRAARAMMTEMRLGETQMQLAMAAFTQGKAKVFPVEATLRALFAGLRTRPDLCRMFVQIQLQAALWGSGLNPPTRKLLMRICELLDVSAYELVQMEAVLRMQRASAQHGSRSHQQGKQARPEAQATDNLADAYAVLGVCATASNADVTSAYRRLMSQNHPDKLHAKGLPEAMMQVAGEKTRQILAAYEAIRSARCIR